MADYDGNYEKNEKKHFPITYISLEWSKNKRNGDWK